MTINERLFNIMQQKKLKSVDLANELEINKTVISAWKSRGTNPPSEYLVQICRFLDISIEYLLTGKESENLSPDEQQLLEVYRAADARGKENILWAARREENQGKSLESKIG